MRIYRTRLYLLPKSPPRSFSTSSILRASPATTEVSSSASTSKPPPPPPRRRSSLRLLPLALSNEVATNKVLQKVLRCNVVGVHLAELGRHLGSKPKLNGGAPTSGQLAKIVRIHRLLKELGIDQKDLRTAMDGLVGLGLFDSHQPSPHPPSSALPSSTSPPPPSPLAPKSSPNLPPPRTTSLASPSLPVVKSSLGSSVADLAKLDEKMAAGLDAKLRANPTSPYRQEWTKHLKILQTRTSETLSGVKASASLLAPGPSPPKVITTASIPASLTSESSSPLPSPSPPFSPSPSSLPLPTTINIHSSLPLTSSSILSSTVGDALKASDEVISQWKREAAVLETKLHSNPDAKEETRAEWRTIIGRLHARIQSGSVRVAAEARANSMNVFRSMVARDAEDGGRRFEGRREALQNHTRALEMKDGGMKRLDSKISSLRSRSRLAHLEEFARENASGSISSSSSSSIVPAPTSASPISPPPIISSTDTPTPTSSTPFHPSTSDASTSSQVETTNSSLASPPSSASLELNSTSSSPPSIASGLTSSLPTPVDEPKSTASPSPDRVASLVDERPPPTTPSPTHQPSTLVDISTIEASSESSREPSVSEPKEEAVALKSGTGPSPKDGEENDASPTPVLEDPRGIAASFESVAAAQVKEGDNGTSEAKRQEEEEMGKEEEVMVKPSVPKPKPSLFSRMFGRS